MVLESQLSALQENCGWEPFNGKLYLFSTDEKNWTDSRDACVTMGGHLVIIESEDERIFLQGHVNVDDISYWIGLTDSVEEDNWSWVDNTAFNSHSDFWYDKEPDNWIEDGKHPEGEDCAHMKDGHNGRFMDAFCFHNKKRICESKAHSSQCSHGG
ncbi:C-type lectin domain family 6 member A-like [Sardina pilchardus]|uniref:C-type lectin domain family 6 member A-like n=1 Tax=Sardina pilchardus TaxID=27697 RepID=UPI002E0F2D14